MKGVELPISTLVIVVIAVIVLLGLVAMYFTGFGPFSTAVGIEGVRGQGCRILAQEKRCTEITKNIPINGFDADRDGLMATDGHGAAISLLTCPQVGTDDNLFMLCHCYYGMTGTEGQIEGACKQLCGCPGY